MSRGSGIVYEDVCGTSHVLLGVGTWETAQKCAWRLWISLTGSCVLRSSIPVAVHCNELQPL